MDSKSSNITSIILAVIALLFVLFGEVASVNSMFGKGSVSGIEALQSKQTPSLAFYLLYVMPIIACVVNITRSEKAPRIRQRQDGFRLNMEQQHAVRHHSIPKHSLLNLFNYHSKINISAQQL